MILTIEEVKLRSLELGFILLSDTYTNNHEKLSFKCENEHYFVRSWARKLSWLLIIASRKISFAL